MEECVALKKQFKHNSKSLAPLGSLDVVETLLSQREFWAPRNVSKALLIGSVYNYCRITVSFISQTKGGNSVDTFRWSG